MSELNHANGGNRNGDDDDDDDRNSDNGRWMVWSVAGHKHEMREEKTKKCL